MKVSIVLPTYNQIDMLDKMVQSIFNQTFHDWELIIVNDGSTDGTSAYLDNLISTTSYRVIIIHQENKKLAAALNEGFKNATGKYYTWVSSDCVCAPYMLEALVQALDKYPESGLVHSDFFIIDTNDKIVTRISNSNYGYRSLIIKNDGNAAFMYPATVAKKIGNYDETINGAEDWNYWIRIADKYPFVYVPESLYYYRIHEGSMQQMIKEEINESIKRMYDKLFDSINNQLRFKKLFPYIDTNDDMSYYAMVNFGADLLTARIPQPINAIGPFRGAIERQSEAIIPWLNLSICLGYLGRWEDALVCIREIKNRFETDPLMKYVNQAEKIYTEKDFEQIQKIPVISYQTEMQQIIQKELKNKAQYSFTLK